MTLEPRPELMEMARRLVWSESPQTALTKPYLFLAQVMTLGTLEDVLVIRRTLGMDAFRQTLEKAPPGVFDPRSWAYWNLLCDRWPPPPLPQRAL